MVEAFARLSECMVKAVGVEPEMHYSPIMG
jgi:hypothetical protein